MFKEAEKLFKILKRKIKAETLENFKICPLEQLNNYHFNLGLMIRNDYLTEDSKLYKWLREIGFENRDEMSSLLIKLFYIYLNKY